MHPLQYRHMSFNSQPREGGWPSSIEDLQDSNVSTRSRAKAAGFNASSTVSPYEFQLAAARRRLGVLPRQRELPQRVSTRSRAKAAGSRTNSVRSL